MKPLDTPSTTSRVPIEVLAQTVGAHYEFQHNELGEIYDHQGVYVARNLTELALACAELSWFTGNPGRYSGISWNQINADTRDEGFAATDSQADQVAHQARQCVERLRRTQ